MYNYFGFFVFKRVKCFALFVARIHQELQNRRSFCCNNNTVKILYTLPDSLCIITTIDLLAHYFNFGIVTTVITPYTSYLFVEEKLVNILCKNPRRIPRTVLRVEE